MAVYDIAHEGDVNALSGVPRIQGTGFVPDMEYLCIWEHAASGEYTPDTSSAVTLDAHWVDSETIECDDIPPASFSEGRLDAQHADGGDAFLITITLAARRLSGVEQIEWSPSGVDAPAWRYDNARCIDGIKNGGEYEVDCGNRAGCGRCGASR